MDTDILEKVLRQFTDDTETLAEFYEARGKPLAASAERMLVVYQFRGEGKYADAVRYAKQHNVIPLDKLRELAREWCEAVMEQQPWEALELAREYHFPELAKKAAVKRSEDILVNPGHDVEPAVDMAKKERADDTDYCRRAARHAYGEYIRLRHFSELPRLISQFRSFFSEEEIDLADVLAPGRRWLLDRQKTG